MRDTAVYGVLLAGGAGTRLWPVSRKRHPKQVAAFAGDSSLIQNTINRIVPLIPSGNIRVVCGREHVDPIARQMEGAGLSPAGKILAEPCGRNTAPAILLALFHIAVAAPDAVVCVFPADHAIQDAGDFADQVAAAVSLAKKGHIVTFGITPRYPETGYGYIEGGEEIADGARYVARFVEKPDLPTANRYVDAGNFFWNSGMFIFNLPVMMAAYATHAPELHAAMSRVAAGGRVPGEPDYAKMPDISIDYAVMEKADNAVVLPVDFGWSDIGSWKSLFDFLPKDAGNNVLLGKVVANRTENCLVFGRHRLVAVNHLKNTVVVDTPDAVFVSDMENSRDVKSIVSRLKEDGRRECHRHRTADHFWGDSTAIDETAACAVDRITVLPGRAAVLSPGSRKTASYTVAAGTGVFTVNDIRRTVGAGETFAADQSGELTIHNPADAPLVVIRIGINEVGSEQKKQKVRREEGEKVRGKRK